ncbi:MAG: hypothetical protein H0U95_06170 [Bacteroidetes bacterium]|nr:hypothetical protein [Bacteroidota bacterium]
MNFFYEKKAKDIYIDKPSFIISCKGLNFDYLVGGSSRVENNFNTACFDSVCHLNGFNIGYSGSAMCQNYLTLYLFLKNGNKTKNYLQQVEDRFLINPKVFTYPFQDYFFMPYIGDSIVDECYKHCVPSYKFFIWKNIPFLKYMEFKNYYALNNLIKITKVDSGLIKSKGYSKLKMKHKKNFPLKSYERSSLEESVDSINIFYLDKIKELCKENNINFIIYSSPIYKESYLGYKPKNLHNALLNYVSVNKIQYFDFMTDEKYSGSDFFLDETHLNAEGTDVFTKQLADTIKNYLQK